MQTCTIPRRHFSSSCFTGAYDRRYCVVYRYGFNGKEKENEISAGDYDFGARIYDSRVARWLAVDPYCQKYPNYSPYVFAIDNPIYFIDNDGNKIVDPDGNEIVTIGEGGTLIYDLSKTSKKYADFFEEKIKPLLQEMTATGVTNEVLTNYITSTTRILLEEGEKDINSKENAHVEVKDFDGAWVSDPEGIYAKELNGELSYDDAKVSLNLERIKHLRETKVKPEASLLVLGVVFYNEYQHLQSDKIKIKQKYGYSLKPGTEAYYMTYNSTANDMVRFKLKYYEQKNLKLDDYVFRTVTVHQEVEGTHPSTFEGDYTNNKGETRSLKQIYEEYISNKNK
jgi:RHS repeat-associated protein